MKLKLCPLIENQKDHFYNKNHAENVHQKLASDPLLVLLNNPKQPLDKGNAFKK